MKPARFSPLPGFLVRISMTPPMADEPQRAPSGPRVTWISCISDRLILFKIIMFREEEVSSSARRWPSTRTRVWLLFMPRIISWRPPMADWPAGARESPSAMARASTTLEAPMRFMSFSVMVSRGERVLSFCPSAVTTTPGRVYTSAPAVRGRNDTNAVSHIFFIICPQFPKRIRPA